MIYLDHCASTRVYDEVIDLVSENLRSCYVNPSSLYQLAADAQSEIEAARDFLSQDLHCASQNLVFTSGATESVNSAYFQVMHKHYRNPAQIAYCTGAHAVSLALAKRAEAEGFQLLPYALKRDASPDLESLESQLKSSSQVLLIDAILVNNETGAVLDLDALVALRDRYAPRALIHVDCVQAWGKLDLYLDRSGIDFASFAGHKIHAPKGVGLLYVKNPQRFKAFIVGGGQQHNRRSGTENHPLVLALAKAVEIRQRAGTIEAQNAEIASLRHYFLAGLRDIPHRVHAAKLQIPQILNIAFPGLRAETLLHCLEREGILVSSSSACHASDRQGSHVLRAMGLSDEEASASIRLSFSRENSCEELDSALAAFKRSLEFLKYIAD
ncbi:MAG: cysteine desulfurase family protein [Eubacteriales bacterium]|nr:cysteine desulfurase family protein [Eubacteriales bacterium]